MTRLLPSLILIGLCALILIGCKINQAVDKVAPASIASMPAPELIDSETNEFDGTDLNTLTNIQHHLWSGVSHGVRSDGKTNHIESVVIYASDTPDTRWPWPIYTNAFPINPELVGNRYLIFQWMDAAPFGSNRFYRAQIFTNT